MIRSHPLARLCRGLLLAMFIACAGQALAAGPAGPVGYVKTAAGSVSVTRGNAVLPLAPGAPVYMNDTLETGPAGAAGVIFNDNTRISIGKETAFTIDEYVYRPRTMELSFLSRISRGTLHFISGNMAKLKPEAVAVKTPAGTIGIRGTRFLVKVEKGS